MILLDVKIYFQGRMGTEGSLNSGTWAQKVNIKAVNAGVFFFMADWKCYYLVSPLGEGNGTPLQYSCLENPMDGEAW